MKSIFISLATLALVSCSGGRTSGPTDSMPEQTDTIVTVDTPTRPVEAVSEPLPTSDDKSFSSAQEAYDEGYYNGQQEGYTDATHHLDYGYSYNDDPEYAGYLKSYIQGYEDGYEDGYNEGLEWDSENE